MSNFISVAVCDDNSKTLKIISTTISGCFADNGLTTDIECFENGERVLSRMERKSFSLVFLDIEMPQIDGISLSQKIRDKKYNTEIVFVTNHNAKVFDALSVHPFGFVRKSNFISDITAIIEDYCKAYISSDNDKFIVKAEDGTLSLVYRNIEYIEGCGKIQYVHEADKKDGILIYSSMKHLEELLSDKGFIRVHNGYIVNCIYVAKIRKDEIEFSDGNTVPISRRLTKNVKEKYLAFMQRTSSGIF